MAKFIYIQVKFEAICFFAFSSTFNSSNNNACAYAHTHTRMHTNYTI